MVITFERFLLTLVFLIRFIHDLERFPFVWKNRREFSAKRNSTFSLREPGYKKHATTNMDAELSAVLEVLSDDSLSCLVFEKEDDDLLMFSMAAILARRNLNRCLGYFEQPQPFYSVDEFRSHFRLKRSPFEVLVRGVVGTGALPVGNVFSSQR